MTSILLVDDDEVLRKDVANELATRGYEVVESGDVQQAIAQIQRSHPDLLLTDLRMDGGDGIDLLTALRQLSPETLPILMSGYASAHDYQRATDLGAVRVLTKPFTPRQLVSAVEHALDCGTGFRGSVHGVSLVDMLQMFHFGRRTIALHIASIEPGTIEFRDGEIVHVVRGELVGVEALRAILATPNGAMSTSVPVGDGDVSIDIPFSALLMDVLRELDETSKAAPSSAVPGKSEDSLDALFEEWVSLRPGAMASDVTERWKALGPLLQRVAPGLGAGIIDERTARVVILHDFTASQEWLPILLALRRDIDRLTCGEGYHHIEFVGRDVACALLCNDTEGYTIALDSVLVDRFAAQRFRSQVRQVMLLLPNEEEN